MPTPNYTDPAELLIIVDANDNPIGAERRDVIHRDRLLHRAIHLFLFRPTGELMLQQRSAKKDMYPLHWECIGGHVAPGDTYEATAYREAEEEAGITMEQIEPICKVPASAKTDQEFLMVYRAVTEAIPCSNPDEVIAVEWKPLSAWHQEIKNNTRQFSPVLLQTIQHIK